MKRWLTDIIAILFVAVVVGWVGIQYGRQTLGGHAANAENPTPTGALVRTAPVKSGTIPIEIVGFGQVGPIPGAVHVYSVPLESRVESILVTPGQRITKGEPMLRVSPSPDTALAFEQAQADVEYADREYELANERLKMKLSTESQLVQAENAKKRAQGVLDNLRSRGLTEATNVLAQEDGILTSLPWSPGSIVPAGSSLADVVPIGMLQVNIWIESEDVGDLAPGNDVELVPVERGSHPKRSGIIRTLAHRVDPSTRLVNVAVDLKNDGFLLGQYVKGMIQKDSSGGLIVPRSALVAKPKSMVVYVERDGVAHEVSVELVAENGSLVIVRGDTLDSTSRVVIEGAAGLSDGTKIEVGQ